MIKLFAAIDIGTNSALLLIGSVEGEKLVTRFEEFADVGLGRDWSPGEPIRKEALHRLHEVLKNFRMTIFRLGARLVVAACTAVFREAKNGLKSAKNISTLLGVQCRILNGEEEANLTLAAVLHQFPGKEVVMLDIGGGSTEIGWSGNRQSLPIGALTYNEAELLDRLIIAELKSLIKSAETPPDNYFLVGVGGTLTTLAMMMKGLPDYEANRVEKSVIKINELSNWIINLRSTSVEQRVNIPGLPATRVDIIVPGLQIFEAFLQIWRRQSLTVTTAGLRHGLLLAWLRETNRLDA
jgi:exopolyphosphatase/guanosine-5'-triphosphate,3'-diphosphate pyrophosphatase